MPFRRNRILKGNYATYKIIAPLSRGAYGETYLAKVKTTLATCPHRLRRSLRRSKRVVLKTPTLDKKSYTVEEQHKFLSSVYEGIERESAVFPRLAATRYAAHIYEIGLYWVKVGTTRVPSHFIVYELIKGQRLDERIHPNRGGLTSSTEFFALARQLATGLGEIHRCGVIHGDVWPENVMIRPNGKPVFIDFGQAIIRREMPNTAQGGQSHAYMAPERRYSDEADIFSLCGVLFFIATGEHPPEPKHLPEDIDALKEQIVGLLRRYNPSLYVENWGIGDIIARGLRRVDNRRTADAERLLEDIELFDVDTVAERKDAVANLNRIRKVSDLLAKKDPLFSRMLVRRVRHLRDYAEQMSDGMYDVRGDHNENVMMVAQFLSAFKKGDQYLTVSIPWLWFRENLGLMGRFLSMSREIAMRGVTVRRVFLITRKELKDPVVLDVLRTHARMVRDISRTTKMSRLNTTEKDLNKGGIFTGIQVMSAKERQQALTNGAHTGIWIRDRAIKMAYPYYDENAKSLVAVKLRPGEKSARSMRNDFVAWLHKSKELRTFLKHRGIRF